MAVNVLTYDARKLKHKMLQFFDMAHVIQYEQFTAVCPYIKVRIPLC